LQVNATRSTTADPMVVTQRIWNDAGGHRDVATTLQANYAGDGHNHWHIRDVEGGTLVRLDNGHQVGALAKHGFCFFDNVAYRLSLTGAPASAQYTAGNSCAFNQPNALFFMQGLSIGWGDSYGAGTNYQWIDITGLGNGKYKLTATADPAKALRESSYANNSAWANIRITSGGVQIIQKGPGI
jgi:hypothetical protein